MACTVLGLLEINVKFLQSYPPTSTGQPLRCAYQQLVSFCTEVEESTCFKLFKDSFMYKTGGCRSYTLLTLKVIQAKKLSVWSQLTTLKICGRPQLEPWKTKGRNRVDSKSH